MAKDKSIPDKRTQLSQPYILSTVKTGNSYEVTVAMQPPVGIRVRDASWNIEGDAKTWKIANDYKPAWSQRGQPRPWVKNGLDTLQRIAPKMNPLKNVTVFPSVDPYAPNARALYRLLMQKQSTIFKCNYKIAQLVINDGTTTVHSRKDEDLSKETLDEFRKTPIQVPYWNEEKTPNEIKAWIDRLMKKLKLKENLFEGYMDKREQGRAVIGVFPEYRDESGKYMIPQVLRVFEPEFTKRPILSYDTGDLEAVQIVGLNTNSGYLDKNRMIYIMTVNNNKFFSTFYGKSDIEGVEDAGRALILINAKDYIQGAEYTWHKPRIFKLTIPARDYANIDTILNDFNYKLNNSAGKDISVTQSVENITGGAGDHGDIAGLIGIENAKIEEIIGFYGVPPFLIAKGKAGRLGGTSDRDAVEAFLETDIRPEQEKLEEIVNTFYDLILAILFDVEPDEVDNAEKVPVLLKHHFRKPKIHTLIDKEQYEIKKDMVMEGLINVEKLARDMGIEDELATPETDTDPMQNPWWNQQTPDAMKGWKPKTLQVGSNPKWPTGWPQYDDWNKRDENGWPPGQKKNWKSAI